MGDNVLEFTTITAVAKYLHSLDASFDYVNSSILSSCTSVMYDFLYTVSFDIFKEYFQLVCYLL